MPDFDINSIEDEGQRQALEAHIKSQIADANKALEANRDDALNKLAKQKTEADQVTQQLQQYQQSFGEMEPEAIQELIKAKQAGDVKALIGEGKLEEAAQAVAQNTIKEQQRQWEAQLKASQDESTDWKTKYEQSDKQNRDNRLGKSGIEAFMKLDDHAATAIGDVNTAVLDAFSLDGDGEPVMYEKDGTTVKLDPKGKPVTIEYFVNELLREQKPHYFKIKEGSGAPGSGSGVSSDFGLGITQRKGVTPELRSQFFAKARDKGVDNPRERWEAIPFEQAS